MRPYAGRFTALMRKQQERIEHPWYQHVVAQTVRGTVEFPVADAINDPIADRLWDALRGAS